MSAPTKTQKLILTSRPSKDKDNGAFADELFTLKDVELPELGKGDVLVEVDAFSCDPTQRIWVTDAPQYMPPVALGEPMRALSGGTVVASNNDAYKPGDKVTSFASWSRHVVAPGASLNKVPEGVPLNTALALGLTGATAYIGLVFVGKVKPGDTVFVSGAAGATGSVVVQLAKLMNCTVIGCAGGAEKCKKVVERYGADACIDYKSEDVGARLKELTKFKLRSQALVEGGVDVYYDNVGGTVLEAALDALAMRARVVICGAIASYNAMGVEQTPGPSNYMMLLMRRATMQGFVFTDYPHEVAEAVSKITAFAQAGKIKVDVDPVEAPFEAAPSVVRRLFTGENKAKCIHVVKK